MDLLEFIRKSKSMYHACDTISKILDDAGFVKLIEAEEFKLESGKGYYYTRNNSSVVAFKIPSSLNKLSFNISASHLDSPTFKLKPNCTMEINGYTMLSTEVYGGPIYSTFMDRPLDIAGRVLVRENDKIVTKLLSFDRAVCCIPNLPIHYNRNANKGVELNPETDLRPILSDGECSLYDMIAERLNVKKDDIISHDLYLSLTQRGEYVGANNEFIMAPQIDNLESTYAALDALISSDVNKQAVSICAMFDNEEIGSSTRCGAKSMMLSNTIDRICNSLGVTAEQKAIALANSFFVSADNAQGYNPDYSSKYDPLNACHINEGVVIKSAARGSYTTDGYTMAIFKELCNKAGAKYQYFTNRSDMPGGSTLGALQLQSVSIPSVDIGFAQLAMHSACEMTGALDLFEMIKVLKLFNESYLEVLADGEVKINVCE